MKKMSNVENFIREKYYDTLNDLVYYLRTGILQITSGVTEFDNENLEKVFNINAELQIKIDKAIEYIKNGIDFKSLHFIRGKDEDMWKIILVENVKNELLEILGDKENE